MKPGDAVRVVKAIPTLGGVIPVGRELVVLQLAGPGRVTVGDQRGQMLVCACPVDRFEAAAVPVPKVSKPPARPATTQKRGLFA
ncbi:hypothetical protein Pan44_26550 [Caulifigura coniformis]|uniref:Uncharacterized protein n=1 Tax=Caulifigura coniformis TaxID=2527983 RepID=A0A517SEV9_9PLAN|nr:hypothetical protein [Caulifigura coniformis]QDT54620.1 hypothetical protein Pan44_26550 [Caulifigura coniformis]